MVFNHQFEIFKCLLPSGGRFNQIKIETVSDAETCF